LIHRKRNREYVEKSYEPTKCFQISYFAGKKDCSYKHRDFSRDRRSKFKNDGMKLAGWKDGKGEEIKMAVHGETGRKVIERVLGKGGRWGGRREGGSKGVVLEGVAVVF
jgi:hypothetical protein